MVLSCEDYPDEGKIGVMRVRFGPSIVSNTGVVLQDVIPGPPLSHVVYSIATSTVDFE